MYKSYPLLDFLGFLNSLLLRLAIAVQNSLFPDFGGPMIAIWYSGTMKVPVLEVIIENRVIREFAIEFHGVLFWLIY